MKLDKEKAYRYKSKPDGYWTEQRVFSIGKSVKTKKEFRQKHRSAYRKAFYYGIFHEITKNFEPLTKKKKCVYYILNDKLNIVRVGCTSMDLKKRIYYYRFCKDSYGKNIRRIIKKKSTIIDRTDYYPTKKALKIEQEMMYFFEACGYKLLCMKNNTSIGKIPR